MIPDQPPEGRRSTRRRPPSRATLLALGLLLLAALLARRVLPPRAPQGAPARSDDSAALRVAPGDAGRLGPCRVEHVIDGDTIDVACPALRERVRLLRIDTPERDEPGYAAASAALRGLIGRRDVYLDFEAPGKLARDEHGRVLAYVFADGRNVDLELVRMGWTRFFKRYGRGRYAASFEAAEREARRERRGLWGMRR